MKYYEAEHEAGYRRIIAEGKTSWGEIHGLASFDDSQIRQILADSLPRAHFESTAPRALEYGCGTGPGACFLAEYGMRVTGIDLSPIAIDLARREAYRRGLAIEYLVGDILTGLPGEHDFDLVVDSYCLQCIVTDADRRRLLSNVRHSLRRDGWYVIATAGYSPSRAYGQDLYEPATGIVLEPLSEPPERYEDAVNLKGRWYLPARRHLTPEALARELHEAGFAVHWSRTAADGDLAVLCKPE
jgi:SAM-dependent methyltransferase